jgi:hypothetical protein
MLIPADDGLPAENSRDEAWFRTSRSRSAVSRTLSCDSTGASAKPSKTRSASPTAARPTRPGHTQYSDLHPSRPSVTPQPPAHNGGSGMHVEAVAITERERGTSEAPGGRIVQGDMSGRCRARRRRRRDHRFKGGLDWAAGAGSAGLPGRDKRAAGLALACASAGLAGAAQGEDHCRLAVHGRFSREGRRRDRPRRTPPPGRPGQRGARPARTRGPAAGGAGPGR